MQQVNRYIVENLGTKEVNILTSQDQELIKSFTLNSVSFDPNKHTVDLKVYDFDDNYLETFYGIGDYTVEGTTVSGGPTHITVNPVEVLETRGYLGDVIAEFEAFNNLFSPRKSADARATLFLSEISSDRTEVRAQSTTISDNAIKSYANQLYSRFNDKAYFSEVYLRFLEQGVDAPCVNVITEVVDGTFYVTFKLYEPLPAGVVLKSKFSVVERIGEPTRFKVTREVDIIEDPVPHLKGPNFEIDLEQQASLTSGYCNLEQLFSYPISSSRYDLLSIYNQNSAEIGLDFTKFSEFVHFSSAEERLENFRYKLELIVGYENTIAELSERNYVDPDIETYTNLKDGVIANFDPYERFLYFTNDPKAWPKSNSSKPYINVDPAETRTEGTPAYLWWNEIIAEAQEYDEHNYDALINAVPEDIRNDSMNDPFVAFVHMVGQHFDEQWTYAKAIADRYDADNRLDFGISKDLVKEALKGFGFTLQESNQNLVPLFDLCRVDGEYDPGTEVIHTFNRITTGLPIYLPIHTYDDEDAARTLVSTIIDGKYATSSGSVSGSIYGPIKAVMNAQVSGTFEGIGSGSFTGIYNDTEHSGPLTGSISGTLDGYLSSFSMTGSVSSSVVGTVSGSFFNGVVVNGGPANFRVAAASDLQPMTVEDYRKEVYKRIYHNIPYLLKTKGTTRGLRALINCFGIPEDILEISVLGNVKPEQGIGPMSSTTSSLDRVRVSTVEAAPIYSGSTFVSASALSRDTKTRELVQNYSDASHGVHVGFNLNKEANKVLDTYLKSNNIAYDDLIGDPGEQGENYSSTLGKLLKLVVEEDKNTLKSLRSPAGIIRLVRYIDSVLFRAVQEFIPARAELQTGVIVEDNILHRNRYKGVEPSGEEKHYEGELETGFITGSDSKAMDYVPDKYQPSWTSSVDSRLEVDDKFDGELSGSEYEVTDGEAIKRNIWQGILIDGNPFKHATTGRMRYNVGLKFLSLPKKDTCNMFLSSSYSGKTFQVYSPAGVSIRYRNEDGQWYDGLTATDVEPITVLDANVGSGTVDSKTASVTGSAPDYTGIAGGNTSGYILIGYDSNNNKHINQVVLEASGSELQRFLGWFSGSIAGSDSNPHLADYIASSPRLVVTQDQALDSYTARFANTRAYTEAITATFAYSSIVNEKQRATFNTTQSTGGLGINVAKYGIVVDGYLYEGAWLPGSFYINLPFSHTFTISKQGFTFIRFSSGEEYTPEFGLDFYQTTNAGIKHINWLR